ncbi:unnamed protein product [Brassica rapa]|uniref:Uncharacterized protein n=3 Tax=Brassica TaxID=3705 RepID=A0A8D9MH50_BRACM|nr:unnamed protein product [Brassica napus]CAG7910002.1 unnamed protein product [Brassica rapa]
METTTRRRRLDLEAYYGRTLPKFCLRFEVTDNGALRLLHHVSLRSLWCSTTETMVILAATILLPSTTTTAEWNSRLEVRHVFSDAPLPTYNIFAYKSK